MDDIKRKNKGQKKGEDKMNFTKFMEEEEKDDDNIKIGFVETEQKGLPPVAPPSPPVTQIKVSFAKFVQLVATHDFVKILQEKGAEEIVISSNLLADLANAHPDNTEEEKKKFPLFFVGGLIIGIILTYLLVKYV